MSTTLSVKAYSGKDNPEFQKHFKAVQFCLENQLSYPKETSEFFKGNLDGLGLEDYRNDVIIDKIKNGLEVTLVGVISFPTVDGAAVCRIKVADIPPVADEIVITIS